MTRRRCGRILTIWISAKTIDELRFLIIGKIGDTLWSAVITYRQESTRIVSVQKRVNVDFPLWMIHQLDKEAKRLGVARQAIIKVWVAERLRQAS